MTAGQQQTRYGNARNARNGLFIESKQGKRKLRSCRGEIAVPA